MQKKKILGFYDYTVVLTYTGMLVAFVGVLLSIKGNYTDAVICLLMAGVCDMFDGAIAGTKDRNQCERHFGIEIDSMSDLISFGVLPAVFNYMINNQSVYAMCVSGGYLLCALIRLAYFNVDELERQRNEAGLRTEFQGIPVTVSALLLPLLYLVMNITAFNFGGLYTLTLAMLGAGFLSGMQLEKPKALGKIALVITGLIEAAGLILVIGMGSI